MDLTIRTARYTAGPEATVSSQPAWRAIGNPPPADPSSTTASWPAPRAESGRRPIRAAASEPATLPETRRCEAALLDDLLALLAALCMPLDVLPERPVSAAALGGALAELERAERSAALPADATDARRRRVLALSGASAHLGALLDQRRRGLLPDATLHDRKATILARLAPFFTTNET